MNEQYVYIARLIDHKNEYIDGYYKVGISKQYTIRETQLNPTHLPIDIQMVRVFKTDNMVLIETILHTCFEDYRVIKKYDDKKDKRTEWFCVDDEELFFNRIDKIISVLPNIYEINLIDDVRSNMNIGKEEKQELIKNFNKSKSKLCLIYDGVDISMENSTDTLLLTLKKISELTSWDMIMEHEIRVTNTLEELLDRNPSASKSQLKHFDNHYVFTGNNNEVKVRNLKKILKNLKINNIQVSLKKL
jgi:hypothetical protein